MLNIIVNFIFLFFLFVVFDTSVAESSEWYLMSRHGQCAEIKVLERKIPNLGHITSPDIFVNLIENRGYDAVVNEMPELNGNAVQVNLPEKDLAVIFVKKLICKGFIINRVYYSLFRMS
jgi:hypothetical protein